MRYLFALMLIGALVQVTFAIPESLALLMWGCLLFTASRGLKASAARVATVPETSEDAETAPLTGALAES